MLPGETREFRISEQTVADLIDHADDNYAGLVAQLLVLPVECDGTYAVPWTLSDKDAPARQSVAAWLPLLEVVEIRDPWQIFGWRDDSEDEVVMWAELRCVGRMRLQGDGYKVALETWSTETVPVAELSRYADTAINEEELAEVERLVREAERLRRVCSEMDVLLKLRQGETPQPPATLIGSRRRRREAYRRERAQPPVLLNEGTVAERLAHLTEVLQWRGLDSPPATSLDALHTLWNVRTEPEALLQLASFAACGWLAPDARVQAAQSRSALKRLQLVCDELKQVHKTAAAKLALLRAVQGYD